MHILQNPARSGFWRDQYKSLGIGVQVGFRNDKATALCDMRIPKVNQAGLYTGRCPHCSKCLDTMRYMRKYSSRFGNVVLTDERKQHILEFHPDIAGVVNEFADALSVPDKVARSVHDDTVIICYRFLPRRKRFLAIVVKTGKNPFILTAYLAKKPKSSTL